MIGAYRDNEVDASHPLMGILDQQEGTGMPIRKLKLEDLLAPACRKRFFGYAAIPEGIQELGHDWSTIKHMAIRSSCAGC